MIGSQVLLGIGKDYKVQFRESCTFSTRNEILSEQCGSDLSANTRRGLRTQNMHISLYLMEISGNDDVVTELYFSIH